MKKVKVSLSAPSKERDYDFYWQGGRVADGGEEFDELVELLDELDQGEYALGCLSGCVEEEITQAECIYDEIGGPVARNLTMPISSKDDVTLHIKMEEV